MAANDTQSPFWLGFETPSGSVSWVHLQGVEPGWTRGTEREGDEFISVGGVRHTQRAARPNREWGLSLEYATADALSALEHAASYPHDVWLFDLTSARVNLLPQRWVSSPFQSSHYVMAGSVPMASVTRDSQGSLVSRVISFPVPAGGNLYVSGWTTAAASSPVLTVNAGSSPVTVSSPPGSGTKKFSSRIGAVATNDRLTITLNATGDLAGLRLVYVPASDTPDLSPDWMQGQGTSCRVDVSDAERTQVWTPAAPRDCDGKLSRDNWSVTLREVGVV